MSTESISVEKREGLGSAACRRLRGEGKTPLNLYGHGEDNVNLSGDAKAIHNLIHSGVKLVALKGAVSDTALISEVQWDAFGSDVLHVDLTRVSQSEKVEVTVPLEVHGEAPGVKAGGMLAVAAHEITLSCSASDIPEQVTVDISTLEMGGALHGSDLQLPSGAELVNPTAEDTIVQISEPAGAADSEEDAGETGAEPEVIAKGKGDEEGGE